MIYRTVDPEVVAYMSGQRFDYYPEEQTEDGERVPCRFRRWTDAGEIEWVEQQYFAAGWRVIRQARGKVGFKYAWGSYRVKGQARPVDPFGVFPDPIAAYMFAEVSAWGREPDG